MILVSTILQNVGVAHDSPLSQTTILGELSCTCLGKVVPAVLTDHLHPVMEGWKGSHGPDLSSSCSHLLCANSVFIPCDPGEGLKYIGQKVEEVGGLHLGDYRKVLIPSG